jgi:hypothetical protein
MCKLGQRQQVVSHRFEAQKVLLGNEFCTKSAALFRNIYKGLFSCLLRRALRKHINYTYYNFGASKNYRKNKNF